MIYKRNKELLDRIALLRDQGFYYREIAEMLNEEKVPTPRKSDRGWNITTVRRAYEDYLFSVALPN